MANWYEPSTEQQQLWKDWLAGRPPKVKVIAERFVPWKLYRLKSTGQRVTMHSFNEEGTCTVNVLGKFNLVMDERRVFGINPDDLEECALPSPDEQLGVILQTDEEKLQYTNMLRARNGVPPLTLEEYLEMLG